MSTDHSLLTERTCELFNTLLELETRFISNVNIVEILSPSQYTLFYHRRHRFPYRSLCTHSFTLPKINLKSESLFDFWYVTRSWLTKCIVRTVRTILILFSNSSSILSNPPSNSEFGLAFTRIVLIPASNLDPRESKFLILSTTNQLGSIWLEVDVWVTVCNLCR